MEKLPVIQFCCNKTSNTSRCSSLATHQVELKSKKNETISTSFRCDAHKQTGTNGKTVVGAVPFDQQEKVNTVFAYLRTLVGRRIKSSWHSAKELEVKYLKDNCGVMCFQPITKKWKYVYYNQITSVHE
jgi:hypothetical protein